ncbi:hypothetical protein HaLaN_08630 [Haematococcus lacustris]|uniref:Uncharacterized protein n=1 Tax=Haematococcus lacustris TaxID=44745 RepID=A0A699Z1G2_HAELA|nr:hypothetical protein HaLaN_08630 [Haematococcus lacustris]
MQAGGSGAGGSQSQAGQAQGQGRDSLHLAHQQAGLGMASAMHWLGHRSCDRETSQFRTQHSEHLDHPSRGHLLEQGSSLQHTLLRNGHQPVRVQQLLQTAPYSTSCRKLKDNSCSIDGQLKDNSCSMGWKITRHCLKLHTSPCRQHVTLPPHCGRASHSSSTIGARSPSQSDLWTVQCPMHGPVSSTSHASDDDVPCIAHAPWHTAKLGAWCDASPSAPQPSISAASHSAP